MSDPIASKHGNADKPKPPSEVFKPIFEFVRNLVATGALIFASVKCYQKFKETGNTIALEFTIVVGILALTCTAGIFFIILWFVREPLNEHRNWILSTKFGRHKLAIPLVSWPFKILSVLLSLFILISVIQAALYASWK